LQQTLPHNNVRGFWFFACFIVPSALFFALYRGVVPPHRLTNEKDVFVAKKSMVSAGEILAAQGYCRISKRKNLAARIDVENWVELLAAHFGKTLHEMFTEILANPGHYEDLFRREWSKDRLDVSLTTMRNLPSSFECPIGYLPKTDPPPSLPGPGRGAKPTGRRRILRKTTPE